MPEDEESHEYPKYDDVWGKNGKEWFADTLGNTLQMIPYSLKPCWRPSRAKLFKHGELSESRENAGGMRLSGPI